MQTARNLSEMIAQFRTPPGFDWKPLAADIETALVGRGRALDEATPYTLATTADMACHPLTIEAMRSRIAELEVALREIELRTRAYADAQDWPLVSGVHSVARDALRKST